MNNKLTVEDLLRWRLSEAETEAPPAPRAVRLLELARPWWELWPDRFLSLSNRVGGMQILYGHAMTQPSRAREGYPVPTVIVSAVEEVETSVRVLYFAVREGRLRLRSQLDPPAGRAQEQFDVTFVADKPEGQLLSARAVRSMDNEYWIDADLSEKLEQEWSALKVTDRMPFRLILRVAATDP